MKNNVKEILLRANLKVNESKTDETVLERKNKGERYSSKQSGDLKLTFTKEIEKWRNTKKLGSLIGVSEDIRRRKQLATAALTKMNNIWIRKDKIKQSLRLKLYKSLVEPILVYNAGTWSPTKKEEDELDSFRDALCPVFKVQQTTQKSTQRMSLQQKQIHHHTRPELSQRWLCQRQA